MYTGHGHYTRTTPDVGWAIWTGHGRCSSPRLMSLVRCQFLLEDVHCLKCTDLGWCFMLFADADVALSKRAPHDWCIHVLVNDNCYWSLSLSWSAHYLADVCWHWLLQISPNRCTKTIIYVCKSKLRFLLFVGIYNPMCVVYERCW